MRMTVYIIIVLLLSCKEKGNDVVRDIAPSSKCDTSFVMLTFSDNMNGRLKNGLMAIFIRGVEEDMTSIFRDTMRTYSLISRDFICLKREDLYSRYYADRTDTLRAAIYKKGVGYSYPFDIILSENKNVINLKLAFTD